MDFKDSIGHGPILELKSVDKADAGWYMCCFINSPLSAEARSDLLTRNETGESSAPNYSCSSVELRINEEASVLKVQESKRTKTILVLISVFSLVSLIVLGLLAFLCQRKLKTYSNAQKAVGTMQNVSLKI